MCRLIRLRTVARLSTFRDTANPSRDWSEFPAQANTLNKLSEETTGFLKTLLKSAGFNNLACRGKGFSIAVIGLGCESAAGKGRSFDIGQGSGRETLPTFGSARPDNRTATTSSHTGAETVIALALYFTGLKCAFHC